MYADAKYEKKNLSSLGKCVTYEARSEQREKGIEEKISIKIVTLVSFFSVFLFF